eukprot:scaffold14570_cov90-Skeletonema_dohrnii-CCMP3373.AAC.3
MLRPMLLLAFIIAISNEIASITFLQLHASTSDLPHEAQQLSATLASSLSAALIFNVWPPQIRHNNSLEEDDYLEMPNPIEAGD